MNTLDKLETFGVRLQQVLGDPDQAIVAQHPLLGECYVGGEYWVETHEEAYCKVGWIKDQFPDFVWETCCGLDKAHGLGRALVEGVKTLMLVKSNVDELNRHSVIVAVTGCSHYRLPTEPDEFEVYPTLEYPGGMSRRP